MLFNMVLPGAVETARLPAEYQEVEYIQSSGTQYIKTKFIPNQNTRVVCKVDFPKVSATAFLFGSRGSGGSLWYNFLCTAAGFRSDFYNDTTVFAHNGGEMLIDKNKNVTTVNGIVVRTSTNGNFTTSYPLYLFAENNAGVVYQPCSATAKFFQIYNGEDLALDYVPCYRKSDGVAGLYDLVNNTFESNSGTGEFIVGPDVSNSGSSGELFEFTYSGNYTDNRINGKGTVRLNTSGTLTVTGSSVTIAATIVGGDAGGAYMISSVNGTAYGASGGDGGKQTVDVTLEAGTYEIVVGSAGAGNNASSAPGSTFYGTDGGDTSAFGVTSTGGKKGGYSLISGGGVTYYPGSAGSPNGTAGEKLINVASTSVAASKCAGAAGYVVLIII